MQQQRKSLSSCSQVVVPIKLVTVRSRCTTQQKPVVVDLYNHSMYGVDRADQYTVYYSFVRRSVKWWRKVFFWLMEVAMVNSYMYRCNAVRPLTHRKYCLSIIWSLTLEYIQTAPPHGPGRPRTVERVPRSGDPAHLNRAPHFLERGPQRDCVVCSDQFGGSRRRTTYHCKTCPSHPPLCPAACFERYHTVDSYRS